MYAPVLLYLYAMCFHYSLTLEQAAIARQVHAEWGSYHWQPVYHADGFSFLQMPVITQEAPERIQPMHWGLIPAWVKNSEEAEKIRAQTLNARAETIFEKPSYRHSIRHQRCLIPADGFFEWMDVKKKKYPHYIYLKQHLLFCFAGIYASWTDRETGEYIDSFSIITCEANPMMARIHNLKQRMPVILAPQQYHDWLQPELSQEAITALLQPYPEHAMENHTIGKLITSRSSSSNVPEVMAPYHYSEFNTLF